MSQPNTAAWAADPRLLRVQIAGRALNTAGVFFLAFGFAIATCTQLSLVARTGAGLLGAVLMVALGEFITRGGKARSFWCGTTTMATGYALAAFFAHATYYVSAVSGFQSPYMCWLLELVVAASVALHGSRNSILRFLSVPITLATTANVLFHALTATDAIDLAGFTVNVSAVGSVLGVAWLAFLTVLYQRLELRFDWKSDSMLERASALFYRITHESYFALAALNALALPKYCGTIENAPLWWALEMPILLAICWNSKSFVKHSLVMGIWSLSAVLLLIRVETDMSALIRMAIPVSGIVMALTYRFLPSNWRPLQVRIGYGVYLYGAVGVAAALPLFHMTAVEALPYWLVQSGVVVVMALALRDRLLQIIGSVGSLVTLVLFGAQWQTWDSYTAISVVVGCYAMSLAYGWVKGRKGLANSEYTPLRKAEWTLNEKEAKWMEIGAAGLGYIMLIAGSFLLIRSPFNTIAWGIEAFALIAFGFLTGKVGHRACGLLTLGITAAKLTIFDLSGTEGLLRILISFGAVGVCFIAAGIFYQVEYVRKNRQKPEQDNPPKEDPGTDNDSGK